MSDVQVKKEIYLEHSFAEGLQKLIFPTGHIWFNLGQNKILSYNMIPDSRQIIVNINNQ